MHEDLQQEGPVTKKQLREVEGGYHADTGGQTQAVSGSIICSITGSKRGLSDMQQAVAEQHKRVKAGRSWLVMEDGQRWSFSGQCTEAHVVHVSTESPD